MNAETGKTGIFHHPPAPGFHHPPAPGGDSLSINRSLPTVANLSSCIGYQRPLLPYVHNSSTYVCGFFDAFSGTISQLKDSVMNGFEQISRIHADANHFLYPAYGAPIDRPCFCLRSLHSGLTPLQDRLADQALSPASTIYNREVWERMQLNTIGIIWI